jgi:hypothetical protein
MKTKYRNMSKKKIEISFLTIEKIQNQNHLIFEVLNFEFLIFATL